MKIVFAAINSSFSHSSLSYGFVRAFNEEFLEDWSWELVENSLGEDHGRFLSRILNASPDVLVSTAYLFNIEYGLKVFGTFKTLMPKVPIYLGGPEFLGDNESFLRRNPHINAVIRGDETSFHKVLTQNNLNNISGLCYIDEDRNYIDGKMTACYDGSLDDIPSPFLKGYFNKERAFCQIETSRGCPGCCSFCTSAMSGGVKYFSIERARSDIQVIAETGCKEIRVIDRTFNDNKKRSLQLLEIFRDEFPQIRFHLEINPAIIDSSFIDMIRTFPAKRLHLEAGIQTFIPEVLHAVKRPASSRKSSVGLKRLIAQKNTEVHADLIAGLPAQSLQNVFDDLKTMILHAPSEIQLERLKILPGTKLRQDQEIFYNPEPPYEVLKTPSISNDELLEAECLSKITDSYYNFPPTQIIFRLAAINIDSFLEKFVRFLKNSYDPFIKPSPSSRLEILEKFFTSEKNGLFQEFTKFLWLLNGFPPEKYEIKTFRKAEWAGQSTVAFSENKELKAERFFSTDFSFDVLKMFSGEEIPPEKSVTLLFCTSKSKKIIEILKR
ncbi:MAG: hypothetical protein A2020_06125 [Lentisphaerae bacterium GWF2_45_14]|nr:MAG: hypothetical protein A2020_06125 [Lentisphaerae bacterium GWF2_45_14]